MNAASIKPAERKALEEERAALFQKEIEGTITRREALRLELVLWSIDRVEDALYGEHLDRLEAAVEEFERLRREIDHLQDLVNRHSARRRK